MSETSTNVSSKSLPSHSSVPAAQYVRMSDEGQQFSLQNQKAAIEQYAAGHGFVVVKTYADAGKSGVITRKRTALLQLLMDVMSGKAEYRAILVYDVSRWGRYQNIDEAAHYEFLCSSAGIPLYYCAEEFQNDGSAIGALMKALKRSMAAEFSRELGIKVFRGKVRIARLGFWVSGPPGYGYRLLMVSANGRRKLLMKAGEHKNLTTDRTILVPGPRKEVLGIQKMFAMASQGLGCAAIARRLNDEGFVPTGKSWTIQTVFNAITNPKYAGCNVWNRTTQKLRSTKMPVSRENWIIKPAAFIPLVDKQTFDRAQAALPKASDRHWPNEKILKSVRRLLRAKGELNEDLFAKTSYVPSPITLREHFGSLRHVYELVGYRRPGNALFRAEQCRRTVQLRRWIFATLQELFPEHITFCELPHKRRSLLFVDNKELVSVLLSKQKCKRTKLHFWEVEPDPTERGYITLLCRMNPAHDGVVSYHLFRFVSFKSHWCYQNDPWLETGIKLNSLSDFYPALTRVVA